MPGNIQNAVRLLPLHMRSQILNNPHADSAEELRLRTGCFPTMLVSGSEKPVSTIAVRREDIETVLENASCSSIYSVADELRRGYITAPGGVRVGVCGCAVVRDGVTALRDISSVSLRVPREVFTAGEDVLKNYDFLRSTLILSPPGGGKTTLLRELVRRSSNAGHRICVADERGEIAGVFAGQAQFDVGQHTDVLSFAPKAEGALMLLRAMNPQIIALDEITCPEDCKAIETVANCGVTVYATAHASGIDDLRRRASYRDVLSLGIFETAIFISGYPNRCYRAVEL
ncbi:MAG: stage III sporulation protein AB [Oscillospiraceae bacterium]|nr:stage III sporulation protein AB [Oscillospiraceae bacterium]